MSITIDSTITEEVLLHAQRIVSFFGNQLQIDMCLIQVPIAALLEAEQYLDKAAVFNNADKIYGKDVDQLEKDITQFNESPLVSAIRNNSKNRCFDCKIPIAKVDFKSFKDGLTNDIDSFLSNGSKLFTGGINASLPNLAYLLSFLCLPDLTKMLSLLLMKLLGTLGKFNLGNFNLTGFIMAIIGKILTAMLSFLNTMLKFSLSSTTCIIATLKSLSELANSVGDEISDTVGNTVNNIKVLAEDSGRVQRAISSKNDPYQKQLDKVDSSLDNFKNKAEEQNKNFKAAINKLAGRLPEKRTDSFGANSLDKAFAELEQTFQDAVNHLNEQVQNLFGLKTYFECEAKRNGTSISLEIEGIQNVIMLINLIKSIIKRKANNIAQTSYNSSSMLAEASLEQEKQFDISDIAAVVADALGKEIAIATSSGTDVGILIGANGPNLNDTLDLFSCNLIDFMDNSDFNNVISDAANIVTSGNGLEPTIPRITLDDIYNTDYVFAPLNPVQLDNIGTQIQTVMDYLGAVSVPVTPMSQPKVSQPKVSNTAGSINVADIDASSITARLYQLS